VGDVDAMCDRVERLLADPALRHRIAAAGVETAHRYAWPLVAAQYERLYRSVKG
jgi:glycosyltransferase involved in cell wall biosynthesis